MARTCNIYSYIFRLLMYIPIECRHQLEFRLILLQERASQSFFQDVLTGLSAIPAPGGIPFPFPPFFRFSCLAVTDRANDDSLSRENGCIVCIDSTCNFHTASRGRVSYLTPSFYFQIEHNPGPLTIIQD